MTDRMELFRQRARTRLAFLGSNFALLARELEMSRQHLQGWMTRGDIKLGHVERVAEALCVPTTFLVEPGDGAWSHLTDPRPEWVGVQERTT